MLKQLLNECKFMLKVHTAGPVLIKSGHPMVLGPDMTPVRTYRNGTMEVYLPGSSLKGVFRSHIEKVIRTLKDGVVCNPFVRTDPDSENDQLVCPDYVGVSCGDKFEVRQKEQLEVNQVQWRRHPKKEDLSNEAVYLDSCPACRLFGSNSFIGRVAISDAYLVEGSQQKTEQRDGVGIDRLTGGAAGTAKFDLEVVSSGVDFETDIYMRNFEVWQLGMLMLIVSDLEEGLIRIGSGRSRGLGNVKATISEVSVKYLGVVNGRSDNEVWGLGKLLGDGSYGTDTDDKVTVEQAPITKTRGFRKITTFSEKSLKCLKQNSIERCVSKIQSWEMPETMQFDYMEFRRGGGTNG